MKPRGARIAAVAAACTLAGCATTVVGTTQTVHLETDPPGARLTVLPEGTECVSPADVTLERRKVHTVEARLPGHRLARGYLDRVDSGAALGNILVGGIIGILVDYDSGAAFDLLPDPLRIELEPDGNPSSTEPTASPAASSTESPAGQPAATAAAPAGAPR